MSIESKMDATADQHQYSRDRRRTLRLLLGIPVVLAAASVVGCADVRPVGSPRPKSYITGNGGADGKSNAVR